MLNTSSGIRYEIAIYSMPPNSTTEYSTLLSNVVRQQAAKWAHFDQYLCRHINS